MFDNFDQNGDICKFWPKLTYFEILTIIIFSNLTKIDISVSFDQNRQIRSILTKIEIFLKLWPNSRFGGKLWPKLNFLKILIKIEIFWQICPNFRFFDIFFIKNRYFRKFWTKSRFFEMFDQNRHICKFWPKSTFSDNFDRN